MARKKKATETVVALKAGVGDTIRITYKPSPFYGQETVVKSIRGNRSRPVYMCMLGGLERAVCGAFMEKVEIVENDNPNEKNKEAEAEKESEAEEE